MSDHRAVPSLRHYADKRVASPTEPDSRSAFSVTASSAKPVLGNTRPAGRHLSYLPMQRGVTGESSAVARHSYRVRVALM
jgi:hypothetical protein